MHSCTGDRRQEAKKLKPKKAPDEDVLVAFGADDGGLSHAGANGRTRWRDSQLGVRRETETI